MPKRNLLQDLSVINTNPFIRLLFRWKCPFVHLCKSTDHSARHSQVQDGVHSIRWLGHWYKTLYYMNQSTAKAQTDHICICNKWLGSFWLDGTYHLCWDHYLFKLDALSIWQLTRSDRKYFARSVNPHDENIFGIFIETLGALNLNISGRSYRGKQCMDKQEQPRSECADTHANLQFHM